MEPRTDNSERGFSLVEMVIVITLTGILASVLANVIRGPMLAIVAVQERSRLVDMLDTALLRMSREIRLALPYSIRVSGNAIEFLRTLDGGRYREEAAGRLDFDVDSSTFTVLNTLANPANIQTGTASTDCLNGSADCLIVYNIGQPTTIAAATASGISANAYLGANVNYEGNIATISAALANSLSFDNSDVAAWSFSIPSPNQRFHIVDTPVSFVCSGGAITRYSGYAIQETQPVPPAAGDNLLVDQITSCGFSFDPPTTTRFGLLTLQIEVTDPNSGESVSLIQQIHVSNIP